MRSRNRTVCSADAQSQPWYPEEGQLQLEKLCQDIGEAELTATHLGGIVCNNLTDVEEKKKIMKEKL